MAGVDPISLAVIGAGVGAVTSPRDPIRGAIMGGALGFGGGSLLGVSAPAAATATSSVVPGSLKAALPELGVATAQSAPMTAIPGSFKAASMTALANPVAQLTAQQQSQMAMRGLQMANQQPQQSATGPSTFRGAKQVTTTEPIQSLLAMAQPRRRERMSLL
jgi:hypothetical protein